MNIHRIDLPRYDRPPGAAARDYLRRERRKARERWRHIRDPYVDEVLERRAAVAHVTEAGIAKTTTATPARTVACTAGDVIVGFLWWFSNTITLTSVVDDDTPSNTYDLKNPVTGTSEAARCVLFCSPSGMTTTASITVTATLSASVLCTMMVHVVSGVDQTTPWNTGTAREHHILVGPGANAATSLDASPNPSVNGCYCAGFIANGGYSETYTAGTTVAWTGEYSAVDAGSEHFVQATAAAIAATFGTTNGFERTMLGLAVLSPAAAGGTTILRHMQHYVD